MYANFEIIQLRVIYRVPYLSIRYVSLLLFFFSTKSIDIFLFLHKDICNGYSFKTPWQGASNEYW